MSVMTTTEKASYDALVSGAAQAVKKDGSVALTADLPMGTHKLTGLSAGSAAGHSVRYEQVALLDGSQAFSADQSMGGFHLTNIASPSPGTTNGANAQYVDEARRYQRTRMGSDFTDCVTAQVSATSPFSGGIVSVVAGAGAAVTINTTGNSDTRIGYAVCSTGTTTTGLAGVTTSIAGTAGGTVKLVTSARVVGDFFVRVPTISTGTETHIVKAGWLIDATHFVQFLVDSNTDTHWKIQCEDGASPQSTTTSIVANPGQDYHLQVVKAAGGDSLEYFIDGVSMGTIATSVPTTTVMYMGVFIIKSAGTTARTVEVDWMYTDVIYGRAA